MKSLINFKKSTPFFPDDTITNPFFKDMDKVINEFYSALEKSPFIDLDKLIINPSIDIVEDEKNFKVEVEMPGMGEEDIKVNINDRVLCIKGKKEISKKDKEKNYISREIGYGSYERDILLPDYVDTDQVTASFKKGMLWVNFPKKSGSEKKFREIKVEKALTK